jgi:hypothetical protein
MSDAADSPPVDVGETPALHSASMEHHEEPLEPQAPQPEVSLKPPPLGEPAMCP